MRALDRALFTVRQQRQGERIFIRLAYPKKRPYFYNFKILLLKIRSLRSTVTVIIALLNDSERLLNKMLASCNEQIKCILWQVGKLSNCNLNSFISYIYT